MRYHPMSDLKSLAIQRYRLAPRVTAAERAEETAVSVATTLRSELTDLNLQIDDALTELANEPTIRDGSPDE